jgi:hypothetical protein
VFAVTPSHVRNGAAGPLNVLVPPVAVEICCPFACCTVTEALLKTGVPGSGSHTIMTETETKIRFVTVPVEPTVIVLVEAFAGAAVTATSNAPTPIAAAGFNLIAPSPVFVAFQALGFPPFVCALDTTPIRHIDWK